MVWFCMNTGNPGRHDEWFGHLFWNNRPLGWQQLEFSYQPWACQHQFYPQLDALIRWKKGSEVWLKKHSKKWINYGDMINVAHCLSLRWSCSLVFLGQRVQCPSLTRRDASHGGDTRSGRLRKIWEMVQTSVNHISFMGNDGQCQFLKRTLIYKMEVFMGFFSPINGDFNGKRHYEQWHFHRHFTGNWLISINIIPWNLFFFDNFVGQSGCFHPSNLNCIPKTIQARCQNGFVSKRVPKQIQWSRLCLYHGIWGRHLNHHFNTSYTSIFGMGNRVFVETTFRFFLSFQYKTNCSIVFFNLDTVDCISIWSYFFP